MKYFITILMSLFVADAAMAIGCLPYNSIPIGQNNTMYPVSSCTFVPSSEMVFRLDLAGNEDCNIHLTRFECRNTPQNGGNAFTMWSMIDSETVRNSMEPSCNLLHRRASEDGLSRTQQNVCPMLILKALSETPSQNLGQYFSKPEVRATNRSLLPSQGISSEQLENLRQSLSSQ